MGLILKREEILDFLKENKLTDGTENIIWANVNNAQGPMVVLIFNNTGIITLPITPLGKIEGDIIMIENSDVTSVNFKKNLLTYKLTIDGSNGDSLSFRINKLMVGYKNQGEELATLIKKYN